MIYLYQPAQAKRVKSGTRAESGSYRGYCTVLYCTVLYDTLPADTQVQHTLLGFLLRFYPPSPPSSTASCPPFLAGQEGLHLPSQADEAGIDHD